MLGASVVGVMKTAQLLRAMNISFINYPRVFCAGWTQGGPECRVDNDKDTRPRKSWWCDCVRVSAVSRCEAGSASRVLASIVLNRRMGRKPGRLQIFTRNTANGSSCWGSFYAREWVPQANSNTQIISIVKLREREGQRVDSGSRLLIVNCRLLIVNYRYRFPWSFTLK